MEGILLFLEGLGKFFGLFGETSLVIGGNWYFGKFLADFVAWLIDFGTRIFG